MKQIALIPFVVFFTSSAFAVGDFSGHWKGPGRIESTVGHSGDCSGIDIVITQTEERMVIENYKSDCGLYGSEWGPSRMTIKDGKVFLDGQDQEEAEEIGTVSEDTLITREPAGMVTYIFDLKLVTDANGEVKLESNYGVENFLGLISTLGTLSRVEN